MALYVKAVDDILKNEVWLKIENGEAEIINDFTPNPFSRVTNILKGKRFCVGIYRFTVIDDVAYKTL